MCRYQESINTVPNVEEISKKILLDGREVERNPSGAAIRYRKRIDVAQIITNEMRNVAESGKEFGTGTRSTCPLIFPGLIMGLLIASRVRIPNVVQFEIKTKVNYTYVNRFFLEKKKKRRQAEQTWQTLSNTLNYGKPDLDHHFMTPEEFQTHIAWPGDKPFYQGEAAGRKDENDEEDAKAEMENEEGTSGG
ncbi:hypothetical protein KIW84_033570 [Lathyrus oleraceus]|uniref:Uncharacterized protein n=1 Tax=Pisum sativum TaxID=3888 RepID=A0A9D5AY60_PEA|nr:hypothetical protein KIW84_033570 [Pisum sativum]